MLRSERPDGTRAWVLPFPQPMRDPAGTLVGAVNVLMEVTPLKRAEQALRQAHDELEVRVQEGTAQLVVANQALQQSQERFRLAVDNFPGAFVLYDAQRRFRFVNAGARARTGLSEQEFLGHTDEELFGPEITDTYLPALRRAAESRTPQSVECALTLPAGTLTYVVHYIPLPDEGGEIHEILGITHDITARKHIEQERARALEALRKERDFISGLREELVSSGASMSWHDLVLYLIARYAGVTAAQEVARLFALQWHQDGLTPYIVFEGKRDHGDGDIQSAQQWLDNHFSVANPVQEMIERSRLAERTFKRRFTDATGLTPLAYVQRLRIEDAKRRLERTEAPIEEISWQVGYEDPAFFRRLFKRTTGLAPGAYRKRFRIPDFARP